MELAQGGGGGGRGGGGLSHTQKNWMLVIPLMCLKCPVSWSFWYVLLFRVLGQNNQEGHNVLCKN